MEGVFRARQDASTVAQNGILPYRRLVIGMTPAKQCNLDCLRGQPKRGSVTRSALDFQTDHRIYKDLPASRVLRVADPRSEIGGTSAKQCDLGCQKVGRFPTRDTADYQSALQQ
jgi:hypothetical protein